MANRIARQELLKKTETIYYMNVENPTFGRPHRDQIQKWIEQHCSWYYWDGKDFYVFGAADYTMFRLWVRGNPLIGEDHAAAS